MDHLLYDMPLFVEVAKAKSFSLAAAALDMPVSTVSRRIAAMERKMGIALFYRNTRSVELTENGKEFFASCSLIVSEARNACDTLIHNVRSPTGKIRLSIPGDLYHIYLMGALSEFSVAHPGIQLHVHFSTRWVDLLTEPFDLEIRAGRLPDSDLKVRKLATLNPGLYAAPGLLKEHPPIRKPKDLMNIPCISLSHQGNIWELHKKDRIERVSIQARHTVNSPSIGMEFALSGQGVTPLIETIAAPFRENGKLVLILPEWKTPDVDISIVMAGNHLPHRIRLFVDYLADCFTLKTGEQRHRQIIEHIIPLHDDFEDSVRSRGNMLSASQRGKAT